MFVLSFNVTPYFHLKKLVFYLLSGRFLINACFDLGSPHIK